MCGLTTRTGWCHQRPHEPSEHDPPSTSQYSLMQWTIGLFWVYFAIATKDFTSSGSSDRVVFGEAGPPVYLWSCRGAYLVGVGLDSQSSGDHADASLMNVGDLDWPTDLQAFTETWGGFPAPETQRLHNTRQLLLNQAGIVHACLLGMCLWYVRSRVCLLCLYLPLWMR